MKTAGVHSLLVEFCCNREQQHGAIAGGRSGDKRGTPRREMVGVTQEGLVAVPRWAEPCCGGERCRWKTGGRQRKLPLDGVNGLSEEAGWASS